MRSGYECISDLEKTRDEEEYSVQYIEQGLDEMGVWDLWKLSLR